MKMANGELQTTNTKWQIAIIKTKYQMSNKPIGRQVPKST